MKHDGRFVKGVSPWNKGITGYMGANRASFKKGDNAIPIEQRFWKYVQKTADCWLWEGYKNNKGYGVIHFSGRVTLAHRVVMVLSGFNINGKQVLHKCDVPLCVNPAHLFLGTQTDNMRDMSTKKRGCNGERAPWAKLSQQRAEEIRSLYLKGGVSMRFLAEQFGVSYFTINYVINRKRWI